MNKKIKFLFFSFISLGILISSELLYLYDNNSLKEENLNEKLFFTSVVGLPDLAISQDSYLRHRSLSGVFEIYSLDPALREYSRATYLISNASEPR